MGEPRNNGYNKYFTISSRQRMISQYSIQYCFTLNRCAYIITSRNGTTMRFFRPTPTLPFLQPNLVPRTNIEYTIITRASTTFKWMNSFCLKINYGEGADCCKGQMPMRAFEGPTTKVPASAAQLNAGCHAYGKIYRVFLLGQARCFCPAVLQLAGGPVRQQRLLIYTLLQQVRLLITSTNRILEKTLYFLFM